MPTLFYFTRRYGENGATILHEIKIEKVERMTEYCFVYLSIE